MNPEADVKEAPPVESRSFTAADRCDKCGAQAKMEFRFKVGSLLFCGHHSRENNLMAQAQGGVPVYETQVAEAAVSLEDA